MSRNLTDRDTLVAVLQLLPPQDLARAACVCRGWKSVTEDDCLWESLCFLRWPSLQTPVIYNLVKPTIGFRQFLHERSSLALCPPDVGAIHWLKEGPVTFFIDVAWNGQSVVSECVQEIVKDNLRIRVPNPTELAGSSDVNFSKAARQQQGYGNGPRALIGTASDSAVADGREGENRKALSKSASNFELEELSGEARVQDMFEAQMEGGISEGRDMPRFSGLREDWSRDKHHSTCPVEPSLLTGQANQLYAPANSCIQVGYGTLTLPHVNLDGKSRQRVEQAVAVSCDPVADRVAGPKTTSPRGLNTRTYAKELYVNWTIMRNSDCKLACLIDGSPARDPDRPGGFLGQASRGRMGVRCTLMVVRDTDIYLYFLW